MNELARPAIEVVEHDEVRFVPDAWRASTSTGWKHPPLVHLPPALVGPSHAGLVLRACGETIVAESEPERARAAAAPSCARTGRARHLVQLGAVALRDPGLAGARRPSCTPSTRPTCYHGPRHHLPLGGPHDHDGHRVRWATSPSTTSTSTRDPGPRRPPDVEDASAPASTRWRRSTSTAPTPCASGCWRCPRPRTCATPSRGRAGPRPREQALERHPFRPDERSAAGPSPSGAAGRRG